MRRGWLVVFAKAPLPGLAKTRLSPPLTPRDAADLYRCLLDDALAESAHAAAILDLEAVLAVDPPGAARELAHGAPAGFRAVAQRGGALGDRMSRIAAEAAAAGAPCALLRGSDSPTLALATLRNALAALATVDLVARPDRDGGYGLVALGPRALLQGLGAGGLFDHPMSTERTLRDTLDRAAGLGLAVATLPPDFDVDRFEDLRELAAARHSNASLPCPRTLAFLDTRGLWPGTRTARPPGSR
jgi:rSAM/selenodomain-associated transferase 1